MSNIMKFVVCLIVTLIGGVQRCVASLDGGTHPDAYWYTNSPIIYGGQFADCQRNWPWKPNDIVLKFDVDSVVKGENATGRITIVMTSLAKERSEFKNKEVLARFLAEMKKRRCLVFLSKGANKEFHFTEHPNTGMFVVMCLPVGPYRTVAGWDGMDWMARFQSEMINAARSWKVHDVSSPLTFLAGMETLNTNTLRNLDEIYGSETNVFIREDMLRIRVKNGDTNAVQELLNVKMERRKAQSAAYTNAIGSAVTNNLNDASKK